MAFIQEQISVYVCKDANCDKKVIKQSELYEHQKKHPNKIINLKDFRESIDTELLKKRMDQIQHRKTKILKEFQISLDNLIKQDYVDLDELNIILDDWESNNILQLANQHQRILKVIELDENKIKETFSREFLRTILDSVLLDIENQVLVEYPMNTRFNFSAALKHQSCTLLTPTIIKSEDSLDKLALLTPALHSDKGIQKFGFKWIKGENKVRFGLGKPEKFEKKKWLFEAGGGTFMIDNNGFIISEYDKRNGKRVTFQFKVGSKIYCYFNAQEKVLTFKHEQQHEKLQLEIDNNPIHPCVALCQINDEVEIIQADEIPDLP